MSCILQSEDARSAVLHYLGQSGIPANLQLKNIFEAMLAMGNGGSPFTLTTLVDRLQDRDQKIVGELTFQDASIDPESATAQAIHGLKALEMKSVDDQRAALRRRIRDVEHEGKLEEALRLADELQKMENEQRPKRNGHS